jgi:transcriptional regulator with XRE-family HTH domain
MPRRVTTDPTLAECIRLRRLARGWSIRFAADRSGVAPSTWSRIERGLMSADNRFLLADIALALECSMSELTGMPIRAADRRTAEAQNAMFHIRQALLETDLADPGERAPRPVAELAAETDLVRALRVRCDYAAVSRILPRLLVEAHAAAHGPGRRQALELLVQVMYTTSSVARYLGYCAEAWIAANRCRDVAATLDDPVLLGFAAFARTHAALACDSFRRAHVLACRAVDDFAAHVGLPGGPETLGMLQLTAALAAAGRGNPAEGAAWMAEAEQIARRTGETTTLDMAFGPTNVRMWQVAIEVDGGDPGRAVDIASRTNPGLVGSPNRQAAFYMDTGRALARMGSDQRAVRMLIAAESRAPQQVHASRLVQESARSMLHRAGRGRGGPELRGLCERLGLPV